MMKSRQSTFSLTKNPFICYILLQSNLFQNHLTMDVSSMLTSFALPFVRFNFCSVRSFLPISKLSTTVCSEAVFPALLNAGHTHSRGNPKRGIHVPWSSGNHQHHFSAVFHPELPNLLADTGSEKKLCFLLLLLPALIILKITATSSKTITWLILLLENSLK